MDLQIPDIKQLVDLFCVLDTFLHLSRKFRKEHGFEKRGRDLSEPNCAKILVQKIGLNQANQEWRKVKKSV